MQNAIIFLPEEEMKLRDDDKKWFTDEIARQLEKVVDSFKPHGWQKFIYWLRLAGPLAASLALVLTLLGITFGALYQSFAHVKEETEFRTHTGDRLDAIEIQLRGLRASQSPGLVLKEIIALDQKNFVKSLPALRTVIQQPFSSVNATPAVLHDVASKLQKTEESSADYWPTVLQFIRFASAGLSPDVPPSGKPNFELHNVAVIGRNVFGTIKRKVVLLDGGELVDQRFENSRIIFTEQAVRMNNVEFVNCVFEMPSVESPVPYLKQASQELLASNLNSVLDQISMISNLDSNWPLPKSPPSHLSG